MPEGDDRMKILIVTVAGMSTRFSESVGYPCLKCIYSENGIEDSLLYRMLHQNGDFDYYVVVGGFMYDALEKVIAENFEDIREKILLVKNAHYADYGSGYSLYLAFERIKDMDFCEVVFAEGDLYVDQESFRKIYDNPNNVITCNREAILASKAVAFYFDEGNRVHYIYDTSHNVLEIKEPFLGIYNSGQIWKMADAPRLRRIIASVSEREWQGTNLNFVQKYFGSLDKREYDIITFRQWVNCNTVSDYNIFKEMVNE